MTNHEHTPSTQDATVWPYHSDTRQHILEQMRADTRTTIPTHLAAAHRLAEATDPGQLQAEVAKTEHELFQAKQAVAGLRLHLSDLQTALRISTEESDRA